MPLIVWILISAFIRALSKFAIIWMIIVTEQLTRDLHSQLSSAIPMVTDLEILPSPHRHASLHPVLFLVVQIVTIRMQPFIPVIQRYAMESMTIAMDLLMKACS